MLEFNKQASIGRTNFSIKKLLAALSAPLLALGLVTAVAVPAQAANDPSTLLNENFDTDGYFVDALTADSVRVEGVLSQFSFLTARQLVLTIEDSKAFARAYKASNFTSFNPDWSRLTASEPFDFGKDLDFENAGSYEFSHTGVTEILTQRQARLFNTASSYYNPAFVISHASGQTYYGLVGNDMPVCTTTCISSATKSDLKSAVESVAGAGAKISGFVNIALHEILVTGKTSTGLPFLAKLNVSTPIATVVANSYYPISTSDFPSGFTSGYTFETVKNGLLWNKDFSAGGVVSVVGNLTSPGKTVGVIFRQEYQTQAAKSTNPHVVFDLSSSAVTRITSTTDQSALGGVYLDGSQEKPFMAATDNNLPFRVTKLQVASSSSESYLGMNFLTGNRAVGNQVLAVASDGGDLRAYTWNVLAAADDATPTETAIESFGGLPGDVSSAIVTEGFSSGSPNVPKLVFAGFDAVGSSKLVVALFQRELGQPVVPGLVSPITMTKNTQFEYIVPSANAQTMPQTNGLSDPPTITWYKCTSAYAGSSITASEPSVPAGCSVYGTTEGAQFSGGSGAYLDYGVSGTSAIGHILISFSYTNPTFNYYSPTIEITSADVGGGSNPSTPSTPSVTSPAISSVTPLRGGAEVSFTPPAGNPAGTTYRVFADDGTDEFSGSGSTSPITVGGLTEGTAYTFRVVAVGPTGTPATPGTATNNVAPLQPGSPDGGFFSGSINIPPSITIAAESQLADSGTIYMISSDVRRILPTGVADTANWGTSGTFSLPGGVTGTVIDVIEVDSGTPDQADVYVLVQDSANPATVSVIKTDSAGVVDTSYGTSGVSTLTPPAVTAPAVALTPQLVLTGSVVGVATPSVDLPATPLAAGFTPTDVAAGPAGSPLAAKKVVAGVDGSNNLVVAVLSTTGSTTSVDAGFNSGAPVSVAPASGTTEVGGVVVDEDGNIYVSATVDGKASVYAFDPTGALIPSFGTNGKYEVPNVAGTGISSNAGGVELVDGRVLVTARESSPSARTSIRALLTPAGFNALPVAVSSSLTPQGGGGSAPAFAGPILSGVAGSPAAAVAGGRVTISGSQLGSVSGATIGGVEAEVLETNDGSISIRVPAGLAPGVYDLVLESSVGKVTIQGAVRVESLLDRPSGAWTRALQPEVGQVETVKMYFKNPVGVGKVQFKVNGREIAWVNATELDDPKLRTRSNGELYLVRTVELKPGKNALEIYVDGERIWRAAYTLK